MFTLEQLLQHVSEYVQGRTPLQEFVNWFEDNSIGAYADPELSAAFAAIEGAFAQYYFDGIREDVLKVELATAIRPFAPVFYYPTSFEPYANNRGTSAAFERRDRGPSYFEPSTVQVLLR